MGEFSTTEVARLIDVTCVQATHVVSEIDKLADAVRKYRFEAVFVMPCYTKLLKDKLADVEDVAIGAPVGFPSGAETTLMKLKQLDEMLEIGVDEIDMVINIGQFKSGNFRYVQDEISSIVRGSEGRVVKCIIEACYLSDKEILDASKIVRDAGAAFVKTGTGWGSSPATVGMIKLIKSAIGVDIKIKAAGGIRSFDTMKEMMDAGCDRFGIGLDNAVKIMEFLRKRANS
jgi:deoxyribose-phosphate aldolase